MNYIQYIRQFVGTKPIIATGAAVVMWNEKMELLLQLRADTNDWGIPGGAMELGDSFEQTAQRELFEETGLIATELKLLTIASGKELYFQYPHGDEVYNATAVYEGNNVAGELKHDKESKALGYFPLDQLPVLNPVTEILLEKAGILPITIEKSLPI